MEKSEWTDGLQSASTKKMVKSWEAQWAWHDIEPFGIKSIMQSFCPIKGTMFACRGSNWSIQMIKLFLSSLGIYTSMGERQASSKCTWFHGQLKRLKEGIPTLHFSPSFLTQYISHFVIIIRQVPMKGNIQDQMIKAWLQSIFVWYV